MTAQEASVATVLAQLNAVPGVLGTMVCDAGGAVISAAFPPGFDPAALERAAAALADRAAGLDAAVGGAGTLDVRCSGARIVVRPVASGRLVCLCSTSVNTQTLALSTSGALRRLEALLGGGEDAAPPSGALHRLLEEIDAAILRGRHDRFKMRGRIALMCGFALDLVDAQTPDDPEKLQKLRTAAATVLGRPF